MLNERSKEKEGRVRVTKENKTQSTQEPQLVACLVLSCLCLSIERKA
jgi:hypothetical protein